MVGCLPSVTIESAPASHLLSVQHLCVSVHNAAKPSERRPVLHDVSFDVAAGQRVALVGESGCGKTMTVLSLLRLLPQPAARIDAGSILFDGQAIETMSPRQLRTMRGGKVGVVFQEPMTCLNPVLTIGYQIVETLRAHLPLSAKQARVKAVELLAQVGLPRPSSLIGAFPHQLSGGMRQRVMLAIAMCCGPKLLIADEPTTALDVTTQAQMMDLLRQVVTDHDMGVLLITHDIGIVADFAQSVVVMYAGRVVERAEVVELFQRPVHPYTRALITAASPGDALFSWFGQHQLSNEGASEAVDEQGCAYAVRCPVVQDLCRTEQPPWVKCSSTSFARCHLAQGEVLG